MKKAFDQTVRDIKRGVNKKVLKVPGIEQKILDATSNEPWGPHGSYLAEIAQATQNFHEYQLIMSVIWKRINDTGKNWRHVYKGLTVLEYLVAHGSERVIDEIKEHVYQISTLSDFQYIDSRGRDQGNNVRRKSQTLVSLVNDKERIQEVREKASANKDKYRNTYSAGGLNRSRYGESYGDRYNDDRYDSHFRYQDDDQHDYSRGRNGRDKDYDRSGRTRYSYSNDGDQYGQDVDRHGRENYKDDDLQFGSRSRSADSRRGHSFDDEDQFSSRNCLARSEVPSPNDRQIDKKIRDLGAPPSYESATSGVEADNQDERKISPTSTGSAPKAASPSPKAASHAETSTFSPTTNVSVPPNGSETDTFDEFDPRSSVASDPAAEKSREMDLLGSLLVEDSLNSALVPVTSEPIPSELDVSPNSGAPNSDAAIPPTSVFGQPNEDLFGDAPFKALPGEGLSTQSRNAPSFSFSQTNSALVNSSGLQPTETFKAESNSNTDFEESLYSIVTTSVVPSSQQPSVMPALETISSVNVLDLAYTPSNISAAAQINAAIPPARSQTVPPEFLAQSLLLASHATPANPFGLPNSMSQPGIPSQHATPNHFPQPSLSSSAQMTASVVLKVTPPKPKFEPKSAVWADSSIRGLLDLNISGPKTNADIGVDFESINRKDKFRMKEKNPAAPMSTITMGKAMGSGSGVGRSGASSLGPSPNPTMAPPMGIGGAYAGGMNQMMSIGIGGYAGGMNHPTGMGMNAGMAQSAGVNHPMGMGMNARMAQSAGINHPMGMGMNAGMAQSAGVNHPMGMGMNARMAQSAGINHPMGMGMNAGMAQSASINHPMVMGMNVGMAQSAGMNHPVSMQMNAGVAQSAVMNHPVDMQMNAGVAQSAGMPPNTGMPGAGYNPMMGMGGYGSQHPYGGGGYR